MENKDFSNAPMAEPEVKSYPEQYSMYPPPPYSNGQPTSQPQITQPYPTSNFYPTATAPQWGVNSSNPSYGEPAPQVVSPYAAQVVSPYAAQGQAQYAAQGQAQYAAQGQAQYAAQGQAPYAAQGKAQYAAQGQAPYAAQGQAQYAAQGQAQYVVVTQPLSDGTPPPETGCTLAAAILAIIFCLGGWPCGIAAIVINRRAKSESSMGQNTVARRSIKTAKILIAVAVIFGIISWVIFGVRLKFALESVNTYSYTYNRNNYG